MRIRGLLLPILVAGCGGDDTSSIPAACNPLGGQGCLLPWPSMTYTTTADTATGIQLDLPADGMPVNTDHIPVDNTLFSRWDGFSPTGPLLAAFPTGVAGDNLPSFKNVDASLAADSPIVLLNMDTGERIPFFAEIDQNQTEIPDRDLIIRPLARIPEKTRVAVAIRNSVKAADGSDLPIPDAFKAIVAGHGFSHPRFKDLAARYPDIFDALSAAGVDKSELVLAWDYVTASNEMLRSDLTTMVNAAIPAMGAGGANLTFTSQVQPGSAQTYKVYTGTFKSPAFLTAGSTPDSIMMRDAAGKPQMNGMWDANFAAIIPNCVQTQPLPRPTVIFGHGLFGSAKDYLDNDFVQSLAEDQCFVILAGDFIGLTSADLVLAPNAVNNENNGTKITEKLAQSVVDFIALETITRGPMATSDAFKFNGTPVIDPAKTYYVGGSLGGIMGNTIMAYEPNITRAVLAVPGGVWSILFERSNAWALLKGSAMGAYPDPAVYELNLAFLGMGMEPYDPITTAEHVIKDPLFGNPVKDILMWYSIGDCLVSNITTEFVARTMGIDVIAPSAKSPWGLTPKPIPLTNGVLVFDEHPTPLPPDTNVPPATDNGTHSGINRRAAALREVQSFLLGDTVTAPCQVGGQTVACDCGTDAAPSGACD
jgi:pimeloyl-ACP methyl ester carboxylesterase